MLDKVKNAVSNLSKIAVEKQISESVKHPIKLNYKVDESLLGGIIIQIGSLMIDTSVKNKLKKYKKLMTEA